MPDFSAINLLPGDRNAATYKAPSPARTDSRQGDDAAEERRAAFAEAEASLALEGMRPSGPLYERLRADIIAGRTSFDKAATELSAAFGSDVE